MKLKSILSICITILAFCTIASFALANNVFYDPQLLPYDGKAYTGAQDPEYISYDQVLRDYMVKRIKQKFGVDLDPKKYSGFDLLEIEAMLRCRKSEEPLDIFLKIFPKQR
jgi:hypothetical protein